MNLTKWLKKSLSIGILKFLPIALMASAIDAALLWGIRSFMNLLSGKMDISLAIWIAIMFLLTLFRFIFLYWKTHQSESWVYNTSAKITHWYLRSLRSVSPFVFHKKTGDSLIEASFEATQIIKNNGNVFFQAIQAILQLLVFLPVLFYISWPLTLFLFLVVVPLVAWVQRKIHAMGPEEESLLYAKSVFRNNLNKSRRLFRTWSSPFERISIYSELVQDSNSICNDGKNFSIRKNSFALIMESVSVLAMVIVLAFCALLIFKGWMNANGLVLFCSAVLLSYKPIKECARVIPQYRALASAYQILLQFNSLPQKNNRIKTNENIFKIENGAFSYNEKEALFNGFNANWQTDKPLLLRGQNGIGKTTLLRLLANLEEWNDGHAILPKKSLDAGVFLMSQDFELPSLSLLQTLLERFCTNEISEFMELICASKLLKKEGHSGGERAKIGLLWALATQAKILLLDEPLASIALDYREKILLLFLDIAKKQDKCVIITSHDSFSEKVELLFNIVKLEDARI